MVNKMGWFGTYTDYENVADYAKHELCWDSEHAKQLDQAIVNSHVYTLVEFTLNDGNIERVIMIDRVERENNQWMHKGWSETSGPYAYDCPERILKLSTKNTPIAIQWRDKCRVIRKDKATRLKIVKLLKNGDIIKSKSFGVLTYMCKNNKTGSSIICRSNLGDKFAYRLNDFSTDELQNAIGE